MRARIYLAIAMSLVLTLVMGCAPAVPTAAPTKPPVAPTAAPTKPAAAPPTVAPTIAPKPAAPTPTPAPKIKRGGILVTACRVVPINTDPIFDTPGAGLKEMALYEALVRHQVIDFKEGKLEIRPELAESWQQVDPKTFVFRLRKGVKFHDGSEFNAEVAKWSLERMGAEPKSLSKRLAENFASLEVVDPYTLRINYKAPSPLHLLNLTPATGGTGSVGPMILSKAHMEKIGKEAFGAGKPSGTGPMKLVEWKRDQEFVLSKFGGYWRNGADGQKLPYLDGIRYRVIMDAAVNLMELRAGSLHLSRTLTPSDLPSIKASPDLEVVIIKWAPTKAYYGFNQEKEPFGKNLKLRQATQHAIDRDSMARVIALDAGLPSYWKGWIPAWVGYDETLPRYEFNLEKAIVLVKESGVANPTMELLTYTSSLDRRVGELLQSMWTKAGITVNIHPVEIVAAKAKVKAGEFEVHAWNTFGHSPDPALYNRLFTCDGAANWSNYCNQETDKCFLEGEKELDPAKRAEIYKRCQRIMQEDSQQAGTFMMTPILVHRKEVKGIKMQSSSDDLDEVWLDK